MECNRGNNDLQLYICVLDHSTIDSTMYAFSVHSTEEQKSLQILFRSCGNIL